MKDPVLKIKLNSGEPKISGVEMIGDTLVITTLILGVPEGSVSISAHEGGISVTTSIASKYTPTSSFSILSNVLKFLEFSYKNDNGVLKIVIPIIEEMPDEASPINITI